MKHEEPLVKMDKAGYGVLSVSSKVNAKPYHDIFVSLPIPKAVSLSAYEQAGRILQQANGTRKEYLIAINARTGVVLADNTEMPAKDRKTGFTSEQGKIVSSCGDGAILIHNHPESRPPSYRDILTASTETSVRGSIIVGHDGSVWYLVVDDPKIADELAAFYNACRDAYGEYAEAHAVEMLLDSGKIEWRKA